MNEDKVSHNIVPGVDDMEYVEMFNLDPALAYTPKINDAILNKVYEDNLAHFMSEGMSEQEAKSKAQSKLISGKLTIANAKNNPQVP